jgi:cytochrome c-type biogenesis protein CcmH
MTIFWILAAGLVALALAFVVLPLLKPAGRAAGPSQDALNLEVFRQRLTELDSDLAAGLLDQERHESARQDLERELLYDLGGDPDRPAGADRPRAPTPSPAPWLAALLALALPAGAVLAYLGLGEPRIVAHLEAVPVQEPAQQQVAESGHPQGAGGQAMPALEVLVERLAVKLEQSPDNLEGWMMLGRTYLAIRQPAKAAAALERAYGLAPGEASVAVAYAEALAAANGNRLEGRPAELIRTALAAEPQNPNALWLEGMLSYQRSQFAEAAKTWESVLAGMDPADKEAQEMRGMIAEARRQGGLPPLPAAPAAQAAAPAAQIAPPQIAPAQPAPAQTAQVRPTGTQTAQAPQAASTQAPAAPTPAADERAAQPVGSSIRVKVALLPALAAQTPPEALVFVYARAVAGPPMPLAAQRLRVSQLPATVTLDDGGAMMPTMKLSTFPQVLVGARVSRSGQAMPQSGDLEGQTGPVPSAGQSEVSVTIDRVRP